MDEREWLADRFEANRIHLRAVACRMLGSLSEADDAVQEAWLRLSRAETRGLTSTIDLARQREVVDAFLAAARRGDFDALDPDVVLRVDRGALRPGGSREVRGALAVAEQVRTFARPVLVNGAAGFVVARSGRPLTVAGFTVAGAKVVEIGLLVDPSPVRRLDLTAVDD